MAHNFECLAGKPNGVLVAPGCVGGDGGVFEQMPSGLGAVNSFDAAGEINQRGGHHGQLTGLEQRVDLP